MIRPSLAFVSLLFVPSTLLAQRTADVEGGKDHPALGRLKGAVIEFYQETGFGTYQLPVTPEGKLDFGKPQALAGKVTRIQYSVAKDKTPELVAHNYKKAFADAGYTVLIALADEQLGVGERSQDWDGKYYQTGGYWNGLNNGKFGLHHHVPNWKPKQAFVAASGNVDGQDVYFAIYAVEHDGFTLVNEDVIEVGAAETGLVTAEKLSKGLAAKGHLAIYDIHFDSGKADIRGDSEAALKAIAEHIKSQPTIRFFIVGHTDNVGGLAANLTLSKARAAAVVRALSTTYGVDAKQLEAHGVASLVPITSNANDKGRALNRRVEIVLQ